MRSEYKRDMNHNYLILTGEDTINTDSYQVRMIVANVVPDLLQCRIQGIDGKFMVYYDVTSRHSMTALFENRKIGMEELQVILGGFIQVMEAMSEYLLNPCIFIWTRKRTMFAFAICPDFMERYRSSFRILQNIFFQNWIMRMERQLCWGTVYTEGHWRTAFIWNISRKNCIK